MEPIKGNISFEVLLKEYIKQLKMRMASGEEVRFITKTSVKEGNNPMYVTLLSIEDQSFIVYRNKKSVIPFQALEILYRRYEDPMDMTTMHATNEKITGFKYLGSNCWSVFYDLKQFEKKLVQSDQ